ncbi:hypothetical protein GSI_02545 [Ganoderma sinense ZZ0214-1]|uniref:Protein kinase domain-containing protein n=1 Tax=Ganoderma sinense ZZ0214-1 TaxID=1077348 RepID=A0A2G8SMF8_9APHY|nr:hypothetical protein GSI_02545 [Ganoderma sinense ZZ0214-1]
MSDFPDYLKVPESLKSHPELVKRGIALDYSLNIGSVYATAVLKPPYFVVKVLNPANEEEAITDRLQHDPSPRNHLIPCEIIRSDRSLLVMPYVREIDSPILRHSSPFMRLCVLLKLFHQIAEGVDHLHRLRIAHIDLCFGNVMVAIDETEREHPRTTAGRVYIIDFDRSRQLDLGPGRQLPIELPSTQCKPPLNMKSFDPYSWDVYCMGKLFEQLTQEAFCLHSGPPWFLKKLCKWVIGDERGCSGVCRCRPTARRVALIFSVVRFAAGLLEILGKRVAAVRSFFVCSRPPSPALA